MSPKTTAAILMKELMQMKRDPISVFMALLLPVLEIILFGYAVNTTVQHIPTVVLNEDRSSKSQEIIDSFSNSIYFDVLYTASSRDEMLARISGGSAQVGVHIPSDYFNNIQDGLPASLQIIIDGTDPKLAASALNASGAIGQVKSMALLTQGVQGPRVTSSPIEVNSRVLFNPDLQDAKFVIPGLIGVVLSDIGIILATFSIVRERERGTLEQLIVSPVRPSELILGKIFPYTLLAVVDILLVIGIAVTVFDITIRGNFFLLFGLCLMFFFVTLGIGLFISTVAQNQMQALLIAILFIIPPIFLSGLVFPRDSMPFVLKYLGYIFPLTYFLVILRSIILKGQGILYFWKEALGLGLLAVVVISLSVLRFQKRLE